MKPTPTNNKRKPLFTILSLMSLAIGLVLTGCAAHRPIPETPPEATTEVDSGGNRYYNYIRSQMESQNDHDEQAIAFLQKAVAEQPDSIFLKKELVYLYLQNNNTDKALETINEILARQPEDIGSLIIAGTIKKQTGHDDEAAAIFGKVLSLNPKQETIYHVLGEYYLEKNDLEKAAAVYEQMTRQIPDSWEGFFFLGKIQARMRKLSEAEKNFRHCLEIDKSLASPRFELIALYRQQHTNTTEVTVQPGDTLPSLCQKHYRKYDDALVKKIIAANPQIAGVQSIQPGQKLILPGLKETCDKGCQKQIINLYNSILTDNPDNARAAMELALYYYSLGNQKPGDDLLIDLGRKIDNADAAQQIIQQISQFFISQQRYDDARAVLNGLLRGTPGNSDLNYLLGMIDNRQQKKDEALQHFSQVGEDSAFYKAARLQMAFLFEEMKLPEKAQDIFDRLLEKEPDNVDLLLYAGSFLERREQYKQAEELFRRGLSLDPKNVDLLFRLGVIYDKTDRKEAAIQQMKSVIEIAPDDANALNYLGYTYADMGVNLDEAQQLIERAMQAEPDNGYITDSLGWVYYQKGEMDKAIELLSRAVQLTPDDPILLEHLGDAYLKSGNTEKALETYQHSLKLAPAKDKEKITNKIQGIPHPGNTP